MTQQSRIQELIEEMEANPHMAAELRDKLLTNDLRDLPTNFREHATRLESLLTELVTANVNSSARMNRMESLLTELATANVNSSARMNRMEQDRSTLKNLTTRIQSDQYAPDLAADLNLTFLRTLGRTELVTIAAGRLTGAPRRSFVQADLVILVETTEGPAYIAAELSYTGAARDTARAVRNAAVIAEATGLPCEPALISVRNDREVEDQVREGLVHWYQLDEKDVQTSEE